MKKNHHAKNLIKGIYKDEMCEYYQQKGEEGENKTKNSQ